MIWVLVALDDGWVDDPPLPMDSPPALWEAADSSVESMVGEWGGVDQYMDDVLVHSKLHRSLAIRFLANCHHAMMDSVD